MIINYLWQDCRVGVQNSVFNFSGRANWLMDQTPAKSAIGINYSDRTQCDLLNSGTVIQGL